MLFRRCLIGCLATLTVLALSACGPSYAPAPAKLPPTAQADIEYRIGPLDVLQIIVYRAPEFTITVPVRPDGRIATPLISELDVGGKTASQVAREMEEQLKAFVQDPIVTVVVSQFIGPLPRQVRVIGEARTPRAVPYRNEMTILDLMVEVGGLTEFAAGNRTVLIRGATGAEESLAVRLDDLMRDGDITANVPMLPGDIVIIPQSWF